MAATQVRIGSGEVSGEAGRGAEAALSRRAFVRRPATPSRARVRLAFWWPFPPQHCTFQGSHSCP